MESNNEILLSVCKDIPNHESFIKIEAINKGLSGDEKYYVETAQGQRYLLRISNIESYERKKSMYDMMGRVASLGVYMSVPVDLVKSKIVCKLPRLLNSSQPDIQ
jgi:aminoglycoside phosphotransferase (APT) family kinase protein